MGCAYGVPRRPSVRCPGTSDAPAGRVIKLTSAAFADLSDVRTWSDFVAYLNRVHRQNGKSYGELEKIGKVQAKAHPRLRDLPKSTVSDALSGKRPIKKDLLESLLLAWGMPESERVRVLDQWRQVNTAFGQGPPNAGRFDEASPRELGVHPAISSGAAVDDLPSYVSRDFDDRLRELLARGVERGCFVALMGGSSCGKTRSLYEAVRDIIPDWWLVHPAKTQEIHDLLGSPVERTVLWLDELHRYLGADPPLRKADIVALVRAGVIVVGTVWPTHYFARKTFRSDEHDAHVEDRLLLEFAELIPVQDSLTAAERRRARQLAPADPRIETALAVSDIGFTQVLAAGPDLVNLWEQAPDPYCRAIISAAADARRLGVQSPLSAQSLTEAMAGYLSPAQRVAPPVSWLDRALRHATSELHGAVSALTPVAGEQAGSLEGYVVADYLTQHIGHVRRTACMPHSLWNVLVAGAGDLDDLRRLASAALARLRYGHAEQALRKLYEANDRAAAAELVTLLRRQDRLGEAIALTDGWLTSHPGDKRIREVRAELVHLQGKAEHFRRQEKNDSRAAELLAELLADGGRADGLRTRAAAGDAVAAEDLAELLAGRGRLDELRELADGGQRFAADRLAELLVSLGMTDELQRRAAAGDPAAVLRVDRLVERALEVESTNADLAQLRAAADRGDEEYAAELTALLFDAGDRAALLDEVNAGTYLAAERYLALLTADPSVGRGRIRQIRSFGLRADGAPSEPGVPG